MKDLDKELLDLSWKIACLIEYTKNLTSKGSYQNGVLDMLDTNIRNKMNSIKEKAKNDTI